MIRLLAACGILATSGVPLVAQAPGAGLWPWSASSPWHVLADWPRESSGAASEADVLRAARGALVVGWPERARAILERYPDSSREFGLQRLALRAAIFAASGDNDSAAVLYERAV